MPTLEPPKVPPMRRRNPVCCEKYAPETKELGCLPAIDDKNANNP